MEKGKKKKKKGQSSGNRKAEPAMHVEPEPCPLRLAEDIPEGIEPSTCGPPLKHRRLRYTYVWRPRWPARVVERRLGGPPKEHWWTTWRKLCLQPRADNSSVMHGCGLRAQIRGFSHKLPSWCMKRPAAGRPEAFVSETVFGMQVEKLTRYRNTA